MTVALTFKDINTKINPTFVDARVGFVPVFTPKIEVVNAEYYEGSTVVVPMRTEQVLHTRNKTMPDDVVVTKIPNNYGLITFNGGVINVS